MCWIGSPRLGTSNRRAMVAWPIHQHYISFINYFLIFLNVLIVAFLNANMEDLKAPVKDFGSAEANDLAHWDLNFWSERLRESKYNIDEVLPEVFSATSIPVCCFSCSV
uniref:Predicted protein n=1 Tax=Hordeum vulgare subsp. vulgare TaxID=112509 RepID=F2DYN6_HORVV|nr:predicted protein [Hordeum vulgare subsp. vulgare]